MRLSGAIEMYDTFKDDLQKVRDTYPYTLNLGIYSDFNYPYTLNLGIYSDFNKMINNCISAKLFTNEEVMFITNNMFYKKYSYSAYSSTPNVPFDKIKMFFHQWDSKTTYYFKNEQDLFYFKLLKD
jgi:hypothetical protein